MSGIRLLVADVDGTLLTDGKKLTPATVLAALSLQRAGVKLALCSARPPLGLRSLVSELGVTSPVAAFNGAAIMAPVPGMPVLNEQTLSSRLVQPVADMLESAGLSMWAYVGLDWYVKDPGGPLVEQEAECVGFAPVVISDWSRLPGRPSKLTGVSDNPDLVTIAAGAAGAQFRTAASVAASTPNYLEVTPPGADKGRALLWLAGWHDVPLAEVAAIGDGYVDIPMFLEVTRPKGKPGIAVAMGNAPDAVKMMAAHVTGTNSEDGFATAVEEFILA